MGDAEHWRTAPKDLSLAENIVHVWRAELANPSLELLSPDERERAAQFHFDKDRNRYVGARAILRQLAGRYENVSPTELRFTYNAFGKPALDASSLRFNTSHSANFALFAFTRTRNIGVDIERIRPDFATREIAARFFSETEVAALRALPEPAQSAAFFACWTRKEALIKAHGSGLSLSLRKFAVSVDTPARLLRTDFDPEAVRQWTLHELFPGEGFVAALAVEGSPERIDCWRWE